VNPGPLTLRELLWMAESHGRADWSRTSVTLALLANAHRDPKKTRAFKPADFNPFEAAKRTVGRTKDLSILKTVFVDNHQLKETRP